MSTMIPRTAWGARRPAGDYTYLASTRGVKIHYTGGYVSPRIVDNHVFCLKLMADIQAMHMSGGRGEVYMDFGYNVAACCHRKILMGRGPHHVPAANGNGLNRDHYAILALVGSTGYVTPTDGLLHGVVDAIEYLRKQGNAGPEIKGHRDGYSTSCPGGPLYAWVRRGAPRPTSGGSAATTTPEEDVPEILSLGAKADQSVPAGQTVLVDWRQEWSDTGSDHATDSPHIAVEAGYWVLADGLVKLRGLQPGEQVDIAWSRLSRDGKTVKDDAWRLTYTADLNGRVEASLTGQFSLNKDVLGVLRVINERPYPVTLERVTMAKASLFKQ